MTGYYASMDAFLPKAKRSLAPGPVACIMVEDAIAIRETIDHHLNLGFPNLIVLIPNTLTLDDHLKSRVHHIGFDTLAPKALERAINQLVPYLKDRWVYYCHNAEFLFFPFCETRSIAEMLEFHSGERRDAMLTYVLDLYSDSFDDSFGQNQQTFCKKNLLFDEIGYFALARQRNETSDPLKRQFDFFGGLRWRFEEYIPEGRRKIDRISLFKSKPGLSFREDFTFSDEEYNTYACPWHHNLTAVVASCRVAKALRSNPGSREAISSFAWQGSVPFEWHSQQLLDLGMMEPGQWF